MDTFFLGVIAFSMAVVAVMAVIRTIMWILVLSKLKKLVDNLYLDYNKIFVPKFATLIDNITSLSGIFRVIKMFKRRK